MAVPPLLRFIRTIGSACPEEDTTDGQLLARYLRQRDEGAFAALLRRHGPMVWGVCRRLLVDTHAAEDAFQASFLVFLRKAASIRRPELLAPFLYGIAQRTALKARSLRARQKIREGPLFVESPAADAAPGWNELRPVLDEELGRLPDKYRLPLILCYLQGQSYSQAAQALGWAAGTVSGRLARARVLLRTRLVRRGLVLSASSLALWLTEAARAEMLPDGLAQTSVEVALGAASPQAITLSKGVLQAMLMSKLKITGAVVLAIALMGGGAGVTTQRFLAAHVAAGSDAIVATPLGAAELRADDPPPLPKKKKDATKNQPPSAKSPDGKLVAVANEKLIALVDAASQKEVRRMAGHDANVTALAFSPDGKRLASAGEDKATMMWDLATGKLLWKFTGQTAPVALEFSADGRTIVGRDAAGKQRILEADTGKAVK
jgi:RNA polymerase sigma factor (sigma-70 family)